MWLHKIDHDWPQLSDFSFLFFFYGWWTQSNAVCCGISFPSCGLELFTTQAYKSSSDHSENDRQWFILSTDIPTWEEVCSRAAIAYEVLGGVWGTGLAGLGSRVLLTWCPAPSEKAWADSSGMSTERDEDSPLQGQHWQTGSLSAVSLVMDWKLKSPRQGVKTSVHLSLQSRSSQAVKDKPSALPAPIRSCMLATCWLSKAGERTANGFPLEFP